MDTSFQTTSSAPQSDHSDMTGAGVPSRGGDMLTAMHPAWPGMTSRPTGNMASLLPRSADVSARQPRKSLFRK